MTPVPVLTITLVCLAFPIGYLVYWLMCDDDSGFVREPLFSGEEFTALVDRARRVFPKGRVLVNASCRRFCGKTSMVFEVFVGDRSDSSKTKTFTSITDAMAWLDEVRAGEDL